MISSPKAILNEGYRSQRSRAIVLNSWWALPLEFSPRLKTKGEYTLRFRIADPITDVIQQVCAGAFKTASPSRFAETPTWSICYFTDFGVQLCAEVVGSTVCKQSNQRTGISNISLCGDRSMINEVLFQSSEGVTVPLCF